MKKYCSRCEQLKKEKVKASEYCTIERDSSRGVVDCYLCDDCLAHVKSNNTLIKIFDPKEKPLTYPIKD